MIGICHTTKFAASYTLQGKKLVIYFAMPTIKTAGVPAYNEQVFSKVIMWEKFHIGMRYK